MPRGAEGTFHGGEEAGKLNPSATKGQVAHMGKRVAREVRISQLGCDSSNVYVAAWSDQLNKKIRICVDTGATRSILRRDLVEPRSNLVINQHERLLLRTATGESSTTLGSVYVKLKLSTSVIEGKFIVADIYDECILGLDLMRKYGLIVDLRCGLLRAPHGDIPLQAIETTAVQQIRSEVDPIQELLKPCQEILSSEQVKRLKKTLLDHRDVLAKHDNDLGRTSLIQHPSCYPRNANCFREKFAILGS